MNQAYANNSAMPMQPEGSWQVQKPHRSLSSVVMTVVLILLIPIIGTGATLGILATQGLFPPRTAPASKVIVPQVTPTPASSSSQGTQLPNPSSFKPTSDKNVNVSLEYPAEWVQDPTQTGSDGSLTLTFHPPSATAVNIMFYVFHFSSATSAKFSSASAINQVQLSSLGQQSGIANLQPVAPTTTTPTIAGTSWTPAQVTFTDNTNNNNIKTDLSLMSVQHNNVYYSLVVISPDSYYNEAVQKYIDHMYTTFQFLS